MIVLLSIRHLVIVFGVLTGYLTMLGGSMAAVRATVKRPLRRKGSRNEENLNNVVKLVQISAGESGESIRRCSIADSR